MVTIVPREHNIPIWWTAEYLDAFERLQQAISKSFHVIPRPDFSGSVIFDSEDLESPVNAYNLQRIEVPDSSDIIPTCVVAWMTQDGLRYYLPSAMRVTSDPDFTADASWLVFRLSPRSSKFGQHAKITQGAKLLMDSIGELTLSQLRTIGQYFGLLVMQGVPGAETAHHEFWSTFPPLVEPADEESL